MATPVSFYGTPVVVAPQRHKVGSTDFVLADDMLTIIAGDDKPIKCVYEGDPIVIMGEPTANGDLTQDTCMARSTAWASSLLAATPVLAVTKSPNG